MKRLETKTQVSRTTTVPHRAITKLFFWMIGAGVY